MHSKNPYYEFLVQSDNQLNLGILLGDNCTIALKGKKDRYIMVEVQKTIADSMLSSDRYQCTQMFMSVYELSSYYNEEGISSSAHVTFKFRDRVSGAESRWILHYAPDMQDDGSMEYRLIGQELKNSDGDKVSYDENLHPKLTGRMRRQAEYLVQSSLRIVPETSSYAAIQKSLMRERPESCIAAAAPAPAPVRFAPPEEITVNPLYQIAQRYRDNPRDLLPAEERRNFLVQFYDDRSEDKTPYIMIRQQWRPDSARLNLDYIDRMNHHRYTCQDCHISIYQDLFNKYGMNCDYHVTLNYVDTHPSGKTPQRRAHLYYHIDKDTLEPVLLAATMKDDIRAKTDHSWQEFDAEQHGGQLQELFSRPMGQLLADYYEHNHHSRPYRR